MSVEFVKPKVITATNPNASSQELKTLTVSCLRHWGWVKQAKEFQDKFRACKTRAEVVVLMADYVEDIKID
jgi:hypothetical protein